LDLANWAVVHDPAGHQDRIPDVIDDQPLQSTAMPATTILMVGRHEAVAPRLRLILAKSSDRGFEWHASADEALDRVRAGGVALIVAHLAEGAPTEHAFRLLIALRELGIPAVFVLDRDDPAVCLSLIKQGAVDCLSPPLNLSRLEFLVEFLAVRGRLGAGCVVNGTPPAEGTWVGDSLFVSPLGQQVLERVRAVAPRDSTVLITGETGTGKTVLARTIHDLSPRRNRPFMVVHCGSLTAQLLESELFGHVRGAFTGADRDHDGRLADVEDGTLLLDEIDCLPLESQARLLRAVEERVFEPVGSTRSQPVRARIIAASNRSLDEEVKAGRFRADLYYRLNVISLDLPPLRQRRDMIEPLVQRFLGSVEDRDPRHPASISPAALRALLAYDWPGNLRELRNCIERAAAFCRGNRIELADLPDDIALAGGACEAETQAPKVAQRRNQLAEARHHAEEKRLKDVLARNHDNRTNAAHELGVSRVTLYKKLRRYGLT
jgi:DNA-binding NtrC family response regulator